MINRYLLNLGKNVISRQQLRYYFSNKDLFEDRKKSMENQYFSKKEANKIKKLHDKLINEGYKFDESEDDVDVDDLLEDRDNIKKILVENGVTDNEELIKILLKWKYKRNNNDN